MGTTTATIQIICQHFYETGKLASSTCDAITTQPATLGIFSYGEILIGFFLFIIMLGLTFGFIINHFVKK